MKPGKKGKDQKKDEPRKPGAFSQFYKKEKAKGKGPRKRDQVPAGLDEPMRLNRFIAMSGLCSRREADALISEGKIRINGRKTTGEDLGFKVDPKKDRVEFGGKELKVRRFVYFLMNKPKNTITTLKDEKGRFTVAGLMRKHTRERVYPVGRLDRNTTGLLLLTNDGELTGRLTHPSYEVAKLYQARLDKALEPEHLEALQKGFDLEDGFIKADKANVLDTEGGNEVAVELHSGRNRIVRRMFEHLGYEVVALDRVAFGPLTKKKLPRGSVRALSDAEVGWLKMLGEQKKENPRSKK